MIKEFVYTSNNGTKDRKVFVIRENSSYIGGIDLNLLSKNDADFITKTYKDITPVDDFKSKVVLEGFDPEWNKAYRQFSKFKISKFL